VIQNLGLESSTYTAIAAISLNFY